MVWYRYRRIRNSRSQRLHYQIRSIRNGMGDMSFQDALHELGTSWKLDNGDSMTRTWADRFAVWEASGKQKIGIKVAWHELAWAKLVAWVARACSTWVTGAGMRDMTWAGMTNRINWHDRRKHELWHEQPRILAPDMSAKHELAWATWLELTWTLTWAAWGAWAALYGVGMICANILAWEAWHQRGMGTPISSMSGMSSLMRPLMPIPEKKPRDHMPRRGHKDFSPLLVAHYNRDRQNPTQSPPSYKWFRRHESEIKSCRPRKLP